MGGFSQPIYGSRSVPMRFAGLSPAQMITELLDRIEKLEWQHANDQAHFENLENRLYTVEQERHRAVKKNGELLIAAHDLLNETTKVEEKYQRLKTAVPLLF